MDPMAEEKLDYGDEDFGRSQEMHYHDAGAIPALAEDEVLGEDDEYDDLYNDVNVGEGFRQMQQLETPLPSDNVGNVGFETQEKNSQEPRPEDMVPQDRSKPGVVLEGDYPPTGLRVLEQKEGMNINLSQQGTVPQITSNVDGVNMGFKGSISVPQRTGVDPITMFGNARSEPAPLQNSITGGPRDFPQMPANQIVNSSNFNVNHPMVNGNQTRLVVENGNTMLVVGELHWWTTDAELEEVCSHYGRVKEITFFDERASGKSKGYCQVEFYESAAAATCKEGMNGYCFNGRACTVAFSSPQTIRQMGASYANKSQTQASSQPQQSQGGRPMNDVGGRGANFSAGDLGTGRGNGRGGWRGGQGNFNRGNGNMRGRGGNFGPRNSGGPGFGNGSNGGGYGRQDLTAPGFGGPSGGFMHPPGMMGTGFDPTYMGRGSGYPGFPGPFPGVMPQFVNSMGLPGVAPHVNPAFFNRGMAATGMEAMGTPGMDGHHGGMWSDTATVGWGGGEEQGERIRESSYGGDNGAPEYDYEEGNSEKGVRSNAVIQEKDRGSEREYSEKRHRDRDEREHERERFDKDYRHREEKHGYRDHRHKDRDHGYKDDWDRGQSSTRSHHRPRAYHEEDHPRSRSRDADYGKRRRE